MCLYKKFSSITLLIFFVSLCVLLGLSSDEMEASEKPVDLSFFDNERTVSDVSDKNPWENSFLLQIEGLTHSIKPLNYEINHVVVSSPIYPTRQPPLDGTFMQPATLDANDIPGYFDEIQNLGMDVIIIQNVRTKKLGCVGEDCCTSKEFHWLPNFPAKLGLILDEAAEHGIEVYVGLDLTSHGLCSLNFYKEPNASLTIEDTRKTVILLTTRYGDHPALSGWYLPDEPSLSEWVQPELTYDYYAGLVLSIKRLSQKPVLISPHLIGVQFLTPNEMAVRALSFQHGTGVDILLWQDTAGAEGAKLKWSLYSRSFSDYLAAIVEYLGESTTWSVHEAFNCCVISSEIEDGAAYRPASIVRMLGQLEDVESIPIAKKITWIQQHHFGSVDPEHHLEADRLMDAYKAQYGLSDEHLLAEAYDWLYAPDPLYDDRGYEMFNLRIGDPNDFTNSEWVGIDGKKTGRAEILIDLGSERTLKWVGFHLMSMPQAGIRFPRELSLACKSEGETWVDIGRWGIPVEDDEANSEYLFSNFNPLDRECRTLKALLLGNDWIFMSEIEIIVKSEKLDSFEILYMEDHLLP
jgi:hypothetical protein